MDTEIEECGLPNWLVSRKNWSNMDSSLTLKTIKGSTRGINMVVNRARSMNKSVNTRKAERRHKQMESNRNKFYGNRRQFNAKTGTHEISVVSQITCHTILSSDTAPDKKHPKNIKLIAYQKLGW